jgi:hypothetical protein
MDIKFNRVCHRDSKPKHEYAKLKKYSGRAYAGSARVELL